MALNRSASTVRRALLYVPSSSPKFLDKSLGLNVDTVCYDLEDSVTATKKDEARGNLRRFLEQRKSPGGIRETSVRINAVETGLALKDLNEVLKAPNVDAIVIPKVNSASDLHFVTDVLRHVQPERHPPLGGAAASSSSSSSGSKPSPIKLIALVESAKSIMNLPSICAASPFLDGLIFAAEDYALDLSITRTPPLTEFLYARSAVVTAARAANLPSAIDLVCTAFRGEQGLDTLRAEAEAGKGMGFNGKQCIHPTQVAVAHDVFAPSPQELEWAVRIAVADDVAVAQGKGAWSLDGKMIDAPVTGKAKGLLARAEACGMQDKLKELRETHKDTQPE